MFDSRITWWQILATIIVMVAAFGFLVLLDHCGIDPFRATAGYIRIKADRSEHIGLPIPCAFVVRAFLGPTHDLFSAPAGFGSAWNC